MKILTFLAGKKTYIIGVIGIVYSLGISRHWWPSDVEVWGILGSAGAMTIRAAIARMLKQVVMDLPYSSQPKEEIV